ncbi:hypothetical protein K458DRAFT_174745 [Lentithecium fluviatile CBS 122367]|uniref:Uncharacterized protein n=1 Tax=Lentithecium fluviatile CBS 122367 TaxID=1168545 RepID=A0A6G1JBZ4_9PLEO|nr:hypothetical protein K458DRAFT_174745 [Lentithecium fluviatile CBS 122367]
MQSLLHYCWCRLLLGSTYSMFRKCLTLFRTKLIHGIRNARYATSYSNIKTLGSTSAFNCVQSLEKDELLGIHISTSAVQPPLHQCQGKMTPTRCWATSSSRTILMAVRKHPGHYQRQHRHRFLVRAAWVPSRPAAWVPSRPAAHHRRNLSMTPPTATYL